MIESDSIDELLAESWDCELLLCQWVGNLSYVAILTDMQHSTVHGVHTHVHSTHVAYI